MADRDDQGRQLARDRVALLVADGVDGIGAATLASALRERGAVVELLASVDGSVRSANSDDLTVDRAIDTTEPLRYDAVAVPCGPDSAAILLADGRSVRFVAEAYRHAKAIAGIGAGLAVLRTAHVDARLARDESDNVVVDKGVVTTTRAERTLPAEFAEQFANLIAGHRVWQRDTTHPSA